MQKLQKVNLYDRLGPTVFVTLSTEFYRRVFSDEEDWFRLIFAATSIETAIQNQSEIFTQRMGGPPLYSQRRNAEALQRTSNLKRSREDSGDHCSASEELGTRTRSSSSRSAKRMCCDVPRDVTHTRRPVNTARPTVSPVVAARWLKHMNDAMDCVSEIDPDSKRRMLGYFEQVSTVSYSKSSLKNLVSRPKAGVSCACF
jgi:truncated hemoglobin YjbI